jgi:hypothetical protein
MQDNNHVNQLLPGEWPRCRDVKLVDGQLHCYLAFDRTYKLLEAYRSDLHLRFLECDSDRQLVSFLKTWGPLYFVRDAAWMIRNPVSIPLSWCRGYQRWLRALIGLLTAFKGSVEERTALQEYIEAEYERERNSFLPSSDDPIAINCLRTEFGIKTNVSEWVQTSNLPMVRAATMFMLQTVPFMSGATLTCSRGAGGPRVEARWNVDTLEDSLRWMVWQDEANGQPVLCCQECRKVFRAESAHVRKYCSQECGHRVASREFQRKKRAEQQERSNKNVAHKTR